MAGIIQPPEGSIYIKIWYISCIYCQLGGHILPTVLLFTRTRKILWHCGGCAWTACLGCIYTGQHAQIFTDMPWLKNPTPSFLCPSRSQAEPLKPLRLDWRLIFWIEEGGDETLCFSLLWLNVILHDEVIGILFDTVICHRYADTCYLSSTSNRNKSAQGAIWWFPQ